MEEFSRIKLVLGANSCAQGLHTLSHLRHTAHTSRSPSYLHGADGKLEAQGAGGLTSLRVQR